MRIIAKNIKKITFILMKKAQAVVQKKSRRNVTSTVLIFFFSYVFLMDVMWKNHNTLKRTALKLKKRNTCTSEKR